MTENVPSFDDIKNLALVSESREVNSSSMYYGMVIAVLHGKYTDRNEVLWQIFADVYIPKDNAIGRSLTPEVIKEEYEKFEIYAYRSDYTDPERDPKRPQPYLIERKGVLSLTGKYANTR